MRRDIGSGTRLAHMFVTAVIPCRNEERFIGKCLDSLVAMDYQKDHLEVLVVDGMSEDDTRSIVGEFVKTYDFVKLIDNPKRILASAWNIGIAHGRGDVIMALNAHVVFEPNYVATCVSLLEEYPEADYIGGVVKTYPQDDTMFGRAAARVLSHPFGVGKSRFRIGTETREWSDTAAFGGYRRTLFDEVGLFNEELVRSQDMEFHRRLKSAGKRTLLAPDLVSHYYTRSTLTEYLKFCLINGFWATYPLRFAPDVVSLRHVVPAIFVASVAILAAVSRQTGSLTWLLLAVGGSYLVLNVLASANAAHEAKRVSYYFLMPAAFLSLHTLYGVGSLMGLLKGAISTRFWGNLRASLASGALGLSSRVFDGSSRDGIRYGGKEAEGDRFSQRSQR